MSRPDEGLIHQWLDGECSPEEAARLEQLVASDPAWAAAVAEARGLIAASSRIVKSLDAVPHAMPAGSKAAPTIAPKVALDAPRSFTVRPWMRLAAGFVLVAGTAYVLRDQFQQPFTPVAEVDSQKSVPAATPVVSPPATPTSAPARAAEEVARIQAPTTVPPLGPVATADRAVGELERGVTAGGGIAPVLLPQTDAGQPAPTTPVVVPPHAAVQPPRAIITAPSPPPSAEKILPSPNSITRPLDDARIRREAEARTRAAADAESARRSALSAESPRGTLARAASVPATAAPASAPPTAVLLEGCWRITAPPELVAEPGLLRLRSKSGDTLVIITRTGDVKAIRDGDTLRGGLQAKRETCSSNP